MKKIAFVWYGESTFIEQDAKLLEKHFDVMPVRFDGIKSIFKIVKAVKDSDMCFSWFADVWSFIAVATAKVFRKKSVVVVGGYDVECLKEIDYGMCTKPFWRRWMRTFALKHATRVLCVSEYTSIKVHYFICTEVEKNIVVYNAVDTNYFKPKGKKENIVLTVASGDNNDIIALKGLDKFVEIAKYIQDTKFVVVGLDEKTRYELSKIAISDNIKLIGKLPQKELLKWYQMSKVYCQLSKVESFGMSLAEAMSCGCVPLVARVGASEEIVGDWSLFTCSEDQTVQQIKRGLVLNDDVIFKLSRQRVIENFPIEKREAKLIEILKDM